MVLVVSIAGRPGCGKTVAACYIAELAELGGYSTCLLNDYDILYAMFEEDRQKAREQEGYHREFEEAEHGGFNVLNFDVLDTALKTLEKKARAEMNASDGKHIIMLEFARDDYCKALEQFSPDFLGECYFLFIQVGVSTCIERIHERIAHPDQPDNHFVSDEIVKTYYGKDDLFAGCDLVKDYQVRKEMKFISNEGSLEDFWLEVKRFAEMIFRQDEADFHRPNPSETNHQNLASASDLHQGASPDRVDAEEAETVPV